MRADFFIRETKKKIVIGFRLIIFFFIPIISFGQVTQEWAQTYSGPAKGMDEAHAVATDASGNIAITGTSINANGDLDIVTIEYNTSGNILWKQIYQGAGNDDDNGKAIAIDGAGNVYIAGYASGKGTGEDMVLIKYDKSGTQLWVQTYNGSADSSDQASAIALDASGNIYITGYSSNKGTGTDMTTIKYDASGNRIWVKSYNGSSNENDAARAIGVDASGNVYVTGYSVNNDTYYDITTIKYSSSGDQQWVKTYNGKADDYDEANALALDAQGNIYITGFTDVSDKRNDIIVIKYNLAGDVQWTQTYNGKGNDDEARAIAVSSGNVYVTGHTTNKNGDYDLITLCYNTSGVQQWIQTYNGTLNSDDEGIALASDVSGNIYVTGYSNNTEASEDIVTIKYNSAGIQQWMKIFNGTENFDDYPYGIILDKSGNVFVTGATNYDILNNTNDGDIILIKYNQSTK